ncbi:hypothetical protein MLD38_035689 [Melastoma candidum]|uniref:Uncharacterized protein n=1 Tax=Melastoma candidum TaxID=119954 RepID=A0ACB9LHE2_9MYRT|nr:hypothetical protein MLD38_035689 [Melastoma candidum]
MEVQETERVVVARPVASRPSCSRFKSFSRLLSGDIDSPCSVSFPEQIVAAIRPKTVRFRPAVSQIPTTPAVPSQVGLSRSALCSPASEDFTSRGETTVVYKPKAKLATRSPISLAGSFLASPQLGLLSQPDAPLSRDLAANAQNLVPRAETDKMCESSKSASQYLAEEDSRSLNTTSNVDSTSFDGYNWRKYGQKQVKSSEYPRSYYKCTHPNCPMKKKVERSFDGQITEIVYKGEHNHAKTRPPKRGYSVTDQGFRNMADDSARGCLFNHLGADCFGERNEFRLENHSKNGSSLLSTCLGKGLFGREPDNSCATNGGGIDGRIRVVETENDGPRSKRRKSESQSSEAAISCEGTQQDGHVVVQSLANADPLGDGFRWRKYGQKVVKGSPYPRSYYRCTSPKCNVRKHIERASNDPTSVVTTYEGKHNHEMPTRSGNPSSDHQ